LWGLTFIIIVLTGMYFIPVDKSDAHQTGRLEDSYDAMVQISNSWKIALATVGNALSIAFFNFFGISVTKVMSASHRMVIDSVRTFVIWGVSLALGWEKFSPLQLAGFAVLLAGTILFQEIWRFPGDPAFWGYESLDESKEGLASNADGPEDPQGLMDSLKTPTQAKHTRSFTTVEETQDVRKSHHSSLTSGAKDDRGSSTCLHKGSMTGSFVGR